jgi:hypothetical protein
LRGFGEIAPNRIAQVRIARRYGAKSAPELTGDLIIIGRLLTGGVPAIAVGLDTLEEMTSPPVAPADPSRIVGRP